MPVPGRNHGAATVAVRGPGTGAPRYWDCFVGGCCWLAAQAAAAASSRDVAQALRVGSAEECCAALQDAYCAAVGMSVTVSSCFSSVPVDSAGEGAFCRDSSPSIASDSAFWSRADLLFDLALGASAARIE